MMPTTASAIVRACFLSVSAAAAAAKSGGGDDDGIFVLLLLLLLCKITLYLTKKCAQKNSLSLSHSHRHTLREVQVLHHLENAC